MPWVYIRAKLAERWGCTPRLVDEEPVQEVQTALRLLEMEALHARKGD